MKNCNPVNNNIINIFYILSFLDSNNSDTIDYKKLLKEEKLRMNKDKITINLPSIVKENSIVHKNSPFTFTDKNLVVTIKSNASQDVSVMSSIIQ